MPTGQPLLSVTASDPRGYAVTRVVPLVADSVRASTRLMPATAKVVGPDGSDLFNGMVDGATTAVATLQPNDAITWTFDRYVGLSSATVAKSLSGTTWQLEMPAQAGGWTAVENPTGLVAGSNASMTYRLRNTGTAAITVGEYPIDNAAQGGAPSIAYSAWGDGRYALNPPYSGTAYSLQIASAQNDPYHPSSLAFAASGSLPDGVAVSTTGLLTVRENLTAGSNGISIPLVLSNGLGRSTSVTYVLFDQSTLVGIKSFGTTRYYIDGTYAVSCAAYTQGVGTHAYVGATGDGTYRIDPDGAGPVPPTDVACSGMGSSTPVTTIPALQTGSHGYPGNGGSTNRIWIDPSWQSFYLALANVSNGQSFAFSTQTESCYDYTTMYSYGGAALATYCGYAGGNFTQTLSQKSANAFWYDNYRADPSINGGQGLSISSPSVNFY